MVASASIHRSAAYTQPLPSSGWRPAQAPATHAAAPIGLYDSGVGGLTVLKAVAARLPEEQFIYIADQAHVPYGGRPLQQIETFAGAQARWLFDRGAKLVVMACNISSATTLEAVEADVGPDHVVGVVRPGAKAAVDATQNQNIGVLATAGTVASGAYVHAIRALLPEALVHQVACPRFVPLVETGRTHGPDAKAAAKTYLSPLVEAEVDVVILGCTHYPFLLDVLREAAPNIQFIDPAEATADVVKEILIRTERRAKVRTEAHALCTTGPLAPFHRQLVGLGWSDAAHHRLTWAY